MKGSPGLFEIPLCVAQQAFPQEIWYAKTVGVGGLKPRSVALDLDRNDNIQHTPLLNKVGDTFDMIALKQSK